MLKDMRAKSSAKMPVGEGEVSNISLYKGRADSAGLGTYIEAHISTGVGSKPEARAQGASDYEQWLAN